MLWVVDGRGDTHEVRARFSGESTAVTVARRYTEQKLRDWGVEADVVAASLIVSELAANAVRHAHSEFEVSLKWADGAVRIAVRDASTARPVPADPAPGAGCGLGLKIVGALASDWGVELGEDGKEVWARLAVDSPTAGHNSNGDLRAHAP